MDVGDFAAMVDDARLEEFRVLWTDYLNDYLLMEHNGKPVIINRDTQLPLMIEDAAIRAAVIQKFIEAGVEKFTPSDK
jgi:hypothetical protein